MESINEISPKPHSFNTTAADLMVNQPIEIVILLVHGRTTTKICDWYFI